MKQLLAIKISLLFLAVLFSISAIADIWKPPSVKSYTSQNGVYILIITPTNTPEKYNQWLTYKNNRHPQTTKVLKKKKKFMSEITARDTIEIHCSAELYRKEGNDSTLIWIKKLLNSRSPVYAVVANDGSSITTFDNWYLSGYGENIFVIYNEKGEAKKSYKLEEISPFPLNDYPISITSIFWRRSAYFIDNSKIEVFFEAENGSVKKRIYNTKTLSFEE